MQTRSTGRNRLPWKALAGKKKFFFFSLFQQSLLFPWLGAASCPISAGVFMWLCVCLNHPLRGFPGGEDSMAPGQGGVVGSIPDWGTKIPHAMWHSQKMFSKINKLLLLSLQRTPVTGFRTTLI